jgi:hypothetical protein
VDYTRISDILSHYVRLAILTEIPVDEALRQAAAAISANKVLVQ